MKSIDILERKDIEGIAELKAFNLGRQFYIELEQIKRRMRDIEVIMQKIQHVLEEQNEST
jgi:hypothetical protein